MLITILNSLGDLTELRGSTEELKLLQDCHLFDRNCWLLKVFQGGCDAPLTLLGESGFVWFRVSLLRSVKDQGRAQVLLKLFSMWKQLQCQYDETVQEVPSEQKLVIDTKWKYKILVANLAHSLQLIFLHWVKVILSGNGWAMARYKVNRWLLSLARGLQSVIIYCCVD